MQTRVMLLPAMFSALSVAFCASVPLRADLSAARAESNLEKRSKLALENATAALKDARQAYNKGDNEVVAAKIEEIQESVDLAYTSLEDTGKNPRKSPKYFKQAEIATRDLVRNMTAFQQQMSYVDRPMLDKVKARVQKVHDDLLLGLLEGRKK